MLPQGQASAVEPPRLRRRCSKVSAVGALSKMPTPCSYSTPVREKSAACYTCRVCRNETALLVCSARWRITTTSALPTREDGASDARLDNIGDGCGIIVFPHANDAPSGA